MMKKAGRPSIRTAAIVAEVLERLAAGESLRAICRAAHLPAESTVRGWAIADVEGFAAPYARARNLGLDSIADEILWIADTLQMGTTTTVRRLAGG